MKYSNQSNAIAAFTLCAVLSALPAVIAYTSRPSILSESDLEYSVGTFAETKIYRSKHGKTFNVFLKEHPYFFQIASEFYSTPNNELGLSNLAVGTKIRIGHLPDPRLSVSSEFKDFILSEPTKARTLQIEDILILSLAESNKAEFDRYQEARLFYLILLFIGSSPLIWKLVSLKYINKSKLYLFF